MALCAERIYRSPSLIGTTPPAIRLLRRLVLAAAAGFVHLATGLPVPIKLRSKERIDEPARYLEASALALASVINQCTNWLWLRTPAAAVSEESTRSLYVRDALA